MRRPLLFLIFFLLMFLLTSRVNAFTTDSEITPEELLKWEVIYKSEQMDMYGRCYIVSENPNLYSPIKYILIRVHRLIQKIDGYAYYKNGKLSIFELNPTDDSYTDGHFERAEVSPQKKGGFDNLLEPYLRQAGLKT